MIFLTNISRNKCIASFCVLLTGKFISGIIFMILGDLQGQNVK